MCALPAGKATAMFGCAPGRKSVYALRLAAKSLRKCMALFRRRSSAFDLDVVAVRLAKARALHRYFEARIAVRCCIMTTTCSPSAISASPPTPLSTSQTPRGPITPATSNA
eukprot:1757193-Pyramimonas_sp.AAC.1